MDRRIITRKVNGKVYQYSVERTLKTGRPLNTTKKHSEDLLRAIEEDLSNCIGINQIQKKYKIGRRIVLQIRDHGIESVLD